MNFWITFLTATGLLFLTQSFEQLRFDEPGYWVRFAGCMFIGWVVGAFYSRLKELKRQ